MNEYHIFVATLLASTLSTIGCMMMIIYFIYFPKERAAAHLFCLWLGISGIGLASTSFVIVDDVDNGDFLCSLFPVIEDYFILCSTFTTVVIAIRVKKIVFQFEGCLSLSETQLKTYAVFVWGLPLLLALLPLTTNSYGRNKDDIYCFILYNDEDSPKRDTDIALFWAIFAFYGPVVLSVSAIIVIYWQCVQQLKILQLKDPTMKSRLRGMVRRIQVYPLIFIIILIIPLYHRIRTMSGYNQSNLVDMLAYNSWKIQGFLDSIAYGSSSNMHKNFSESIRLRVASLWAAVQPSIFQQATVRRSSNVEISERSSGASLYSSTKNVLIQESSLFTLRDTDDDTV